MLFEFDRHFSRIAARQMAEQSLEDRQRDVYESHRHRVFSVSYYMTGSEIEAEEILEGTFVRAFGQAPEPDQAGVDTALVEQLEEREILVDGESVPVPASAMLPGFGNILRADLEAAIRCLPARERIVFLLMDVEGYPAARIAGLLRMQEPEVRRTAMTARLRLRAELAASRQDDQQAA